MAEFRTQAPGTQTTEDSGGEGKLDEHFNRVVENIKSDPELQLQIAEAAQNNGIDPMLLRAVFPGAAKAQEEKQQMQPTEEAPEDEPPRVKTVTEQPTPDQLEALLEQVSDLSPDGHNTTIQQMVEFINDEPGMVETAIKMEFR